MEKVSTTLTIINNGKKEQIKQKGQYDEKEKCLILEDSLEETEMIIDLKNGLLKRETKEFNLTIPWKLNQKTKANINLKAYAKSIDLTVQTEKYEYRNRNLKVKYKIIESKENIEYEINF